MAQALCDDHRPEPVEPETVSYALPLGYPNTAVTCDVVGCEMPARLWLSKDERTRLRRRPAGLPDGSGSKVRVADDLFPN